MASIDQHFVQYPGAFRFQATWTPPHEEDTGEDDESNADDASTTKSEVTKLKNTKRPSQRTQEMIMGMDNLIRGRLELYQLKNSGRLPDTILFYRDGVSEGQFQQVIDVEIEGANGVRSGLQQMYGANPLPKLIVVCVVKRHHTRFFPPRGEKNPMLDKHSNPLPGMVVDEDITTKSNLDWFAVTHKAIQGTAKPAHYVVLIDEANVTADQIQNVVSIVPSPFLHLIHTVSLISFLDRSTS